MKNIKIFVSCHKQFEVPSCRYLYPIQVGSYFNRPIAGYLHDSDGADNISQKNKRYCELTAQYYAYKNEDADYYGFFHYRRYLSFSHKKYKLNFMNEIEAEDFSDFAEKFGLNEQNIEKFISDYDVILPHKQFSFQNRFQYRFPCTQDVRDLDFCTKLIKKKYPQMKRAVNRYLRASKGYFCNQFIMKKDIFLQYSSWLFEILEEHEKAFPWQDADTQTYRVSGYLGERLLGIYVTYLRQQKKVKILETPRIVIKKPEIKVALLPQAPKCFVIPFDKEHLPLASVLVQSIVDCSRSKTEIILAHSRIEGEYVAQIKRQAKGNENIVIQDFAVENGVTSYEEFLLKLPRILANYDRVSVLKPNGIFLREPNFAENGFAGVKDVDFALRECRRKKFKKSVKKYGLKSEQLLSSNRLEIGLKKLQEVCGKIDRPAYLEILSKMQKDIALLPQECMIKFDSLFLRAKQLNSYVPYHLFDQYNAALKNPEYVSFDGYYPPYDYPLCNFSNRFFEVARKTPFYELLLYRMMHAKVPRRAKKYQRKRARIDKLLPPGTYKRLFFRTISKKYY